MGKRDFYETKMRIQDRMELDEVTDYLISPEYTWRYEKTRTTKKARWLAVYKGGGFIFGVHDNTYRANLFRELMIEDFMNTKSLTKAWTVPQVITPKVASLLDSLDNLI